MGITTLYDVLRGIVAYLSTSQAGFAPLPFSLEPDTRIKQLGLHAGTLPPILKELKSRLGGRDVLLPLNPEDYEALDMRGLLGKIRERIVRPIDSPMVVYVDDEEENLFVFKRKFAKEFQLTTFTHPRRALEFILSEPRVSLVITDEVMPEMSGNALCSEVRKHKPLLKFILITGNPNNDQDLLYNSLRHNRFYEFISKPLDLEKNGKAYLCMILSLIREES